MGGHQRSDSRIKSVHHILLSKRESVSQRSHKKKSEQVTLFPEVLTVVHADTVRGTGCKKLNNRMRSVECDVRW
jgi:hypothetical protein